MPQFVTYSELKTLALNEREARGTRILESRENELPSKNLFLSHSSKDDEFLPGIVRILENHGASVYVDRRDQDLPKDDFGAVAEKLRKAVKACPRFVLFVTENSKDSRWIPWELGLGDGTHNPSNVALFPSAENWFEQSWATQEYLGLYRRIVFGKLEGEVSEVWMVLDHVANTATKLNRWIKGY